MRSHENWKEAKANEAHTSARLVLCCPACGAKLRVDAIAVDLCSGVWFAAGMDKRNPAKDPERLRGKGFRAGSGWGDAGRREGGEPM